MSTAGKGRNNHFISITVFIIVGGRNRKRIVINCTALLPVSMRFSFGFLMPYIVTHTHRCGALIG